MSNDNAPVPNALLREAATSTAFALVVSKRHIEVLNCIALGMRTAPYSHWVPTVNGLMRRGLIEHRHSPNWNGEYRGDKGGINAFYRLTRAGWLMHDLLAEAGLVERCEDRKRRKLVA